MHPKTRSLGTMQGSTIEVIDGEALPRAKPSCQPAGKTRPEGNPPAVLAVGKMIRFRSAYRHRFPISCRPRTTRLNRRLEAPTRETPSTERCGNVQRRPCPREHGPAAAGHALLSLTGYSGRLLDQDCTRHREDAKADPASARRPPLERSTNTPFRRKVGTTAAISFVEP